MVPQLRYHAASEQDEPKEEWMKVSIEYCME